jgi:aspartyl-tRNA(Asn)/glutamyl-tRNA(Gln) amidotransferase subunit C
MDPREREPGSGEVSVDALPRTVEEPAARAPVRSPSPGPGVSGAQPPIATAPLIAEADVRRIAALAHLPLSGDDVTRFTHDLQRILGYVRQLEAVDVTGVPATAHVLVGGLRLRDDDPWPSLSRDEALREAPRVTLDGFAVPSFVDDEGSPAGSGG